MPGDVMPLVRDPDNIRLAIAGRVTENDHPYSWSAILNGYDPDAMRRFADPVIERYLSARSKSEIGIPGVRVTHIWCDREEDAKKVAQASKIERIVSRAEDLIGAVDAVLIPTDRGEEHVGRARPFIEAGIPVFIDKPLCDNETDLRLFCRWVNEGKAIMSCSAMRYATEFSALRDNIVEVGEPRLLTITMAKKWPRYGIHALEAVYPFLVPGGWQSLTNTGRDGADMVHIRHASGVDVVVAVIDDLFGAFGQLSVYGTKGRRDAQFRDSFSAFKAQLSAFVGYLRTGERPFAFDETIELMKLVIAGEISKRAGGRRVALSEIAT